MKSVGFVFHAVAKHFYTVLTSVEFQLTFNFSISKLAMRTQTRGNVLIDNFSVLFFWVKFGLFSWLENRFKVCICDEWHLKLVLPIVKLYE